jgi:hypothetical protein
MPTRITFEIDRLTLLTASCFFKSDLALAGAFLSCVRGTASSGGEGQTHWNNSTTVVFAVSRTALSASSRQATRLGTYARNNRPCDFVIYGRAVRHGEGSKWTRLDLHLTAKSCSSPELGGSFPPERFRVRNALPQHLQPATGR